MWGNSVPQLKGWDFEPTETLTEIGYLTQSLLHDKSSNPEFSGTFEVQTVEPFGGSLVQSYGQLGSLLARRWTPSWFLRISDSRGWRYGLWVRYNGEDRIGSKGWLTSGSSLGSTLVVSSEGSVVKSSIVYYLVTKFGDVKPLRIIRCRGNDLVLEVYYGSPKRPVGIFLVSLSSWGVTIPLEVTPISVPVSILFRQKDMSNLLRPETFLFPPLSSMNSWLFFFSTDSYLSWQSPPRHKRL